jgi:hypothetical protein
MTSWPNRFHRTRSAPSSTSTPRADAGRSSQRSKPRTIGVTWAREGTGGSSWKRSRYRRCRRPGRRSRAGSGARPPPMQSGDRRSPLCSAPLRSTGPSNADPGSSAPSVCVRGLWKSLGQSCPHVVQSGAVQAGPPVAVKELVPRPPVAPALGPRCQPLVARRREGPDADMTTAAGCRLCLPPSCSRSCRNPRRPPAPDRLWRRRQRRRRIDGLG